MFIHYLGSIDTRGYGAWWHRKTFLFKVCSNGASVWAQSFLSSIVNSLLESSLLLVLRLELCPRVSIDHSFTSLSFPSFLVRS